MSFIIKREDTTAKQRNIIRKLTIKSKKDIYDNTSTIHLYRMDEKYFFLPMGIVHHFQNSVIHEKKTMIINSYMKIEPKIGTKYGYQIPIINEAMNKLNRYGTCMLKLSTGAGKTMISITLAQRLGLKTLFVTFSDTLKRQACTKLSEYCNLKGRVISGDSKNKINQNFDIGFVGGMKLGLIEGYEYGDVGTLIVDEAQQMFSTEKIRFLIKVRPKYLILLSATPYEIKYDRDIYHNLIYPDTIIEYENYPKIRIVKYETDVKPEIIHNALGVDWTHFDKSSYYCDKRLDLVSSLVDTCWKKRKPIMVLLKYNYEVDQISKRLLEKGVGDDHIQKYYKGDKLTDKIINPDILLTSNIKAGVGYDGNIDIFLLSIDISNITQAKGRLRKEGTLLIDVVDDHYFMKRRWERRENVYRQHKCSIVNMNKMEEFEKYLSLDE